MKYLDALKRKKVYLNVKSAKSFEIDIQSGEYLKLPIESQYNFIEERFNEVMDGEELGFANTLVINLYDTDEDFLDETSVFNLISNTTTFYARKFPTTEAFVKTPTGRMIEDLPITPFVSYMLMSQHVVNKPIQVIVKRNHLETDSYEEVTLI